MRNANARMMRLMEMVDQSRRNHVHLNKNELEQILSDCQQLFSIQVCELVQVLVDQILDSTK